MRLSEPNNPITLSTDKEIACITGNWTVNALMAEFDIVLEGSFIVSVQWVGGGGFLSRVDWDTPLPVNSTVRIIGLPRGGGGSNPLQIIAAIVIMAASYYTGGVVGAAYGAMYGSLASAAVMVAGSLLMSMFFGQSGIDSQSDSLAAADVYSLSDGGNALRIGSPFAERFGRLKIYPDLVQMSYTVFEDNEQYLYFYGIIGVGEYDIEEVYIDETPMLDYVGTSYNVLPPGETLQSDGRYLEAVPTMATNVVWLCTEISGQELDTEGIIAIVSGRGTSARHIEYDLQFGALVTFNDDGSKKSTSVTVIAEVRKVDDDGQPIGSWIELNRRTYTASSIDTLRYSHKIPAPAGEGRYQIKLYRTTAASTNTKTRDAVSCMGVKAYGGVHPWYGDVTCIEAKIRATDKLSGDVVNKINVVATRKLHTVTESGLSTGSKVPTTSIIDAIAYIVTCENGGRQEEEFVKFDTLAAIKLQVDSALGHSFNWAFTSQGSVMDACKLAATCSRMMPYLPGGQFCLVRDDYQELPGVTYTEDDFTEGSLMLRHSFLDPSSPTCVKVNYVNGLTWGDDFVTYYDSQGSEDRPYEIELSGCTSRDQAYQYAAYFYKDMMLNRTTVEFETGLKGHIPALFRKIAVCAANVDWGQSGIIVGVDEVNELIWLSEPVDFQGEASGKLLLSLPDGTTAGPYTVTPTANVFVVGGAIIGLKTLKDDGLSATKYLFGPYSKEFLLCRLMSIQPQGRNALKIVATMVDDTIYDLPGEPPLRQSTIPVQGLLDSVSINYTGDTVYTVSWSGGAAAYKIQVDIGSGYTTIADAYSGYTQDISTSSADITVKITPYDNEGTLQTASAIEVLCSIPPTPSNLSVVLTSSELSATWDSVSGAVSYVVSLLSEDTVVWVVDSPTASAAVLLSDLTGVETSPDMGIEVYAVDGSGVGGFSASAVVPVQALSAPSGLALQSVLSGAVILTWEAVSGASGYMLYKGASSGFDPESEGVLVYSGSTPNTTVVLNLTTPYSYFFKVAATDVFHQDVNDLAFSSALPVSG